MNRPCLLGKPRSFLFTTNAVMPACGLRLGFTNNSDSTSEQSLFFVDITGVSASRAAFTFSCRVPGALPITDILFNDGRLLNIAVDMDSGNDGNAGLNGSIFRSADNPDLPGPDGRSSTVSGNRSLPVDKDPVTRPGGYGQYESLVIIFDLMAGVGFADIVRASNERNLCITIKAQGLEVGDNKTFINNPMRAPGYSSYPL